MITRSDTPQNPELVPRAVRAWHRTCVCVDSMLLKWPLLQDQWMGYSKLRIQYWNKTCTQVLNPNDTHARGIHISTITRKVCTSTSFRHVHDLHNLHFILYQLFASQKPTLTPFVGESTISDLSPCVPSCQYFSILSKRCRILTMVYDISVRANCCPMQILGPPLNLLLRQPALLKGSALRKFTVYKSKALASSSPIFQGSMSIQAGSLPKVMERGLRVFAYKASSMQ